MASKIPLRFENVLVLLSAAGAVPALGLAALLIAGRPLSAPLAVAWLAASGAVILAAVALRRRSRRPLQTLANFLAALREGDFSFRLRARPADDALGLVLAEANAMAETLHRERLGAAEAEAMLRAVMAEVDVAIFTFDEETRLRLVNRAGERLIGRTDAQAIGLGASELGLADCLAGESTRTVTLPFRPAAERWSMRRARFREQGVPRELIVLSDVSRTLREEEGHVWERLVRVLGHEVNNSLAPIKSIAGSLQALLRAQPLGGEIREDVERGLSVMASRAESLARFLDSYSRIARLPQPQRTTVDVPSLVRRVAGLERRVEIAVGAGPALRLFADGDQIEQALVNLVRNAADAALETGGAVSIGWSADNASAEVVIDDGGPGLANLDNLFVPFYTTKRGGSGIGLVLARRIAEAHGGSVTLENRSGARGCRARLRLPTRPERSSDQFETEGAADASPRNISR